MRVKVFSCTSVDSARPGLNATCARSRCWKKTADRVRPNPDPTGSWSHERRPQKLRASGGTARSSNLTARGPSGASPVCRQTRFEECRVVLYNQPSGPQASPFTMLWLAFVLNPSSKTTSGPSGESSPFASGIKMIRGGEHSHTPPKPSVIPLSRCPFVRNTFRSSNFPSPFASLKMTTRSWFSGLKSGYEKLSTTHTLPRSSKSNAIGCNTSGSPANNST